MKKIGVVFSEINNKQGFWKRLFSKNRFQTVTVKEYGLEFLCVYDNQNCAKIFNKNSVENIVIMTDKPVERCNFRILDGERMYRKMLPDFVRKTAKSFDGDCTVTVVDKNLTKSGIQIVETLCSVLGNVTVCTDKTYDAERLCDRLFDKMGVVLNVVDGNACITSHIVAVLEDCGNSYGPESIVIDKNCKRSYGRVVNDFYIPFSVKPPFGMSNLVFAECIELTNKKIVDIQ